MFFFAWCATVSAWAIGAFYQVIETKAGGAEGPLEWLLASSDVLKCLDESWRRRGLGFALNDGDFVSMLVWADNIWVVAETREDLDIMLYELSNLIYSNGLAWKKDSLEVLVGGVGEIEE